MATSPSAASPPTASSPAANPPAASPPTASSPAANPPAASPPTASPPTVPLTVEVDDQATENDSTYGDEVTTYTASLTSSVVNYRYENGRRYHAFRDGRYALPNDEEEKDRLDMVHELMLTIMDRKLFLAPISDPDPPARVLDLGTGTGLWAIDFADQFPSAEVWGNDLSPIQPTFVPPNIKFIIDDFEDEWAYGDLKFDFIHARYLAAAVKDFPRLIQQCYDNTTPGGWVEFQDFDLAIYSEDGSVDGTSIKQYYDTLLPTMAKNGMEPSPGPKLEGWFREAGFEDIHVEKFIVPMGAWPKDKRLKTIGTWNLLQAMSGFEAHAMAPLTRHAGWSKEEATILIAKTINDSKNPDIHPLWDCYVVYGRKPR